MTLRGSRQEVGTRRDGRADEEPLHDHLWWKWITASQTTDLFLSNKADWLCVRAKVPARARIPHPLCLTSALASMRHAVFHCFCLKFEDFFFFKRELGQRLHSFPAKCVSDANQQAKSVQRRLRCSSSFPLGLWLIMACSHRFLIRKCAL